MPDVADRTSTPTEKLGRIHPATRLFACLLAVTGFIFLPAALMLPLLIPGIAVWIGYCLIAFGRRSTNSEVFWITSVVWNVIALVLWFSIRAADTNFSYVTEHYPLIHSLLAIAFSAIAIKLSSGTKPSRITG